MSWSARITSGQNLVFLHGDKLKIQAEIQNRTNTVLNIQIDLGITYDGISSNPVWPGIDDKIHICQPGNTIIDIIPESANLLINRNLQWIPGIYNIDAKFKSVDSPEDWFQDTIAIRIEPRKLYPMGRKLIFNNILIQKLLIWGPYNLICRGDSGEGGHEYQLPELATMIQLLKSKWPGGLGFRCWIMSGVKTLPHIWRMAGNKFDLEQWDNTFINRVHSFLGLMEQQNIVCILDLFDHYMMCSEHWNEHPLNPQNNIQHSYDLPLENEAFPMFYRLSAYPQFALFQKRYCEKVAEITKQHSNVIVSTGNEMVSGELAIRQIWHKQILDWFKAIDPWAVRSENDLTDSVSIHTLPEVQFLQFHNLGGVEVTGPDTTSGLPNWDFHKTLKKPVLYDNDGMWQYDFRLNPQNNLKCWLMVRDTSGYFGCKCPFYLDPNWNIAGLPTLDLLAQNY